MYFINYYLLPLYDYCYCYDLYSVLYVLPRLLNVYFIIYCDLDDKWRHINWRSSCDDDMMMIYVLYTFFADFEKSINYTISVVFQTYYSNAWYWNATTRHLHTFVFHLLCFIHRLTTGKYYRQTTMNAKRSWTDLLQSILDYFRYYVVLLMYISRGGSAKMKRCLLTW